MEGVKQIGTIREEGVKWTFEDGVGSQKAKAEGGIDGCVGGGVGADGYTDLEEFLEASSPQEKSVLNKFVDGGNNQRGRRSGLRAFHWKRTREQIPDQCVPRKLVDSLGGETVASGTGCEH